MKDFHINTEIFFGENALDRLSALRFDSALIISDPFVVSSGMITLLTARLDKAHIRYELFTDVVPDPPVEKVIAGVAVAVGAVAGVLWRRAKKKVQDKLGIDENAGKEVEEDVIELDED